MKVAIATANVDIMSFYIRFSNFCLFFLAQQSQKRAWQYCLGINYSIFKIAIIMFIAYNLC